MQRHAVIALASALAATIAPAHSQQARSPDLPPLIIEATEALCFPIMHASGDPDALTAAYTSPGLGKRGISAWVTKRWAWEETAPAGDTPFAELHFNMGDDGSCGLAYAFIDENTDTAPIAARLRQWANSLPGFIEIERTDTYGLWANVEERTELSFSTGYTKGTVFTSYSRQ